MATISNWLSARPEMQNQAAKARVEVALARLPNVLERQLVANQRTLEQKISEQGPSGQRVDPHLLGLAIHELSVERRILSTSKHHTTGSTKWFANARHSDEQVRQQLDELAPLYAQVATGSFPNRVGDALEIVVEACLLRNGAKSRQYSHQGTCLTKEPLNKEGRVTKIEPPNYIGQRSSKKLADFHLYGFDCGPICVECKNTREWFYPDNNLIKELIFKSVELDAVPLLIGRRFHYSTISNLLLPAGILFHETLHQYYPPEESELADRVRNKRLLGFTDVSATYEPALWTNLFFESALNRATAGAASRFREFRDDLMAFAKREISISELYRIIRSPAANGQLADDFKDIPF